MAVIAWQGVLKMSICLALFLLNLLLSAQDHDRFSLFADVLAVVIWTPL